MILSIKRRYWGYFFLVVSLLIIYVATISPFNFTIPQDFSGKSILKGFRFGSNLKDYWHNILLFIPFGFSISIIVNNRQKLFWITIVYSLLAGLFLSISVEITQLFLPSRVSNLTDIIYNSLGGLSGGILYSLRGKVIFFVGAIITGNIDRLSYRSILTAILGYCLTIAFAISILSLNVNLSNWDDNYYLAIGNEVTGNRPWDGYIKNLYISDRGLDPQEIEAALQDSDRFFGRDSNALTHLVFNRDRQVYRDENRFLPDLISQDKSRIQVPTKVAKSLDEPPENICLNRQQSTANSVHINANNWLKTQVPATPISQRLKQTSKFAIATTFASNNLNQGGPARIVSLSKNISTQNIILGQRKRDLYFRLRTPITGLNATNPEFFISNVLNDCLFHHVLIEFDNNRLDMYLDSLDKKYSFAFNSFNNYPIFISWSRRGRQIDLNNFDRAKQKQNFYTITLIPLGLLLLLLPWKYIHLAK